jgi:hypothetical protein
LEAEAEAESYTLSGDDVFVIDFEKDLMIPLKWSGIYKFEKTVYYGNIENTYTVSVPFSIPGAPGLFPFACLFRRSLVNFSHPSGRRFIMNKKKSSPWIPLIVALVACASFISSSGDEEPAIIFASIAVVLVITLAVLAAQKAKAKKTEARNGDSIPDDPRMKTFTKPDAPCVVCEHTGEDHLARDKQNRIRQLDDWLKSGLIDRAEYAVLKDRYERDM